MFVDHFSDYVYVAIMQDLGLDKTLLEKSAFERHANKGGISIASYQADNGRFADAGFQKAIKDANQSITFCAIGAHHENGIVEWRIKELTLISRTLLLHAKRHWPDYITTMMWPFALKEAPYHLNRLSLDQMVKVVKHLSSTLKKIFLIQHLSTSLDHHVLFWIQDCNLELLAHLSGNLVLD